MSCISVTGFHLASSPSTFRQRDSQLHNASKYTSLHFKITKLPKLNLTSGRSRSRRAATPVCLFGGKGKSQNGNEGSPWKAIENAMGKFTKGKSVEDVLKQQIQKQEYFDDGGSGGKGPPGGGGGGGGFGGAGDESPSEMWEEWTQVFCATFAFIFVYMFIIEGEEITVLVKDSIRYLFRRQKSMRLGRLIDQWNNFIDSVRVKEEYDPNWLEREIINTHTLYDSPTKYIMIARALSEDSSDDEGY